MSNRIAIIFALFATATAACGGGDDAPPADAFFSKCGQPGDPGNELGIGKFCASQGDCADTQGAPLCSSLGDPDTHFCTTTCEAGGPAGQCGADVECTCNDSNQCGCTPSICLN